jgi:hypothetical protein
MTSYRNKVGSMLGYVGRLMKRMPLQGWPPADPLYEDVCGGVGAARPARPALIYLAAPAGTAGGRAAAQQKERPVWAGE